MFTSGKQSFVRPDLLRPGPHLRPPIGGVLILGIVKQVQLDGNLDIVRHRRLSRLEVLNCHPVVDA